jgi:hypothetical protein
MSLKLLHVPDRRGSAGVRESLVGACVGPTDRSNPAAVGNREPSLADQMYSDFHVIGCAPMFSKR